jgi:hypothetical protein
MKYLVAAALLLAAPASAQTSKPAPAASAASAAPATAGPIAASVYANALAPGWSNWSFAATEVGVDTGGARKPIKVEAKGYQALYLHHDPFSTAPFRGLSMLIQSVGGEARVRIVAVVGGKPIEDATKPATGGQPALMTKVVSVKPGGWSKVVVPLAALGADNKQIDGIWVQNDSADPAPNFYVADIAFES